MKTLRFPTLAGGKWALEVGCIYVPDDETRRDFFSSREADHAQRHGVGGFRILQFVEVDFGE